MSTYLLAGVVFGLSFYILQSILQPCLGSSVRLFLAFRARVLGFEVEALDFRFVVVTLLGLLLLLPSFRDFSRAAAPFSFGFGLIALDLELTAAVNFVVLA